MKWIKELNPVQIIVLGYLILILLGTGLLSMPFSNSEGTTTNLIDSLFTACSAVCITGLTVVDTFSHWSTAGKVIIISLIQIGGLGFMTMVTLVFMALHKKITFKERTILQESLNLNQKNDIVKFVKYIFIFTLIIESLGAILLFLSFIKKYSLSESIFYSIFHSISAFCNAGFDILGNNSLTDYIKDGYFCFVMSVLIITGGLGFTVWAEIINTLKNIIIKKYSLRYSTKKLSLHSKLTIIITCMLLISGTVFFFISEYHNINTLEDFGFIEKLIAASFQSVTLRSAGFYTISQKELYDGSKLISMIFMAIGGSPTGTAGGIKTVTIGIIVLAIIAVIKGNDSINIFGRCINMYTLQKALAVTITMIIFIICGTVILTFTEANSGYDFINLLYEMVATITTVGLSTGITPYLTSIGKIVIIIGMFFGRLGPITIAIAISSNKNNTGNLIHYPQEDIMIG